MKKQLASSAVLLLTACIWGCAFVAQVFGARYLDAYTFNASRFLLGGVALIPICLVFDREKADRARWRATVMAGLCGGGVLFVAALLQQYGMEYTPNPGRAGFITGLYTVLTPILYFLFFKKHSGLRVWLGAVLAVVGLYLLCFNGTATLTFGAGEALILLGAFFWALHIIVIERFAPRVSPLRFACCQFLVCGGLNLIAAFLLGSPSVDALKNGVWAILFCGLLSTGVGYTGQIIGQRMAKNPTRAAILLSTESLFSLLGGVAWNLLPIRQELRVDASINLYGVLGCIVIFAAIVLSQLPEKRKENALS
ncbi:MAG: DMT family transporter [Ruminococcaceae bacterium]|nr:DMT family transporter [Oscillospiraceae bacterium]